MDDSQREGLGGAFILLILARLRETSLCCLTTRSCAFRRGLRVFLSCCFWGFFLFICLFFLLTLTKICSISYYPLKLSHFFSPYIIWARYFFIQHSWFLDHACSFSMQLSFCCSSHKAAENQGNSNILSEGDEMWDRFSVFLCHCWSPIQSGTE